MIRLALALVVGFNLSGAGVHSDESPVEKLAAAKTRYEAEMEKFRVAAGEWFDQREDRARKGGDKKLVDQIKAERLKLKESGDLPATAGVALFQRGYAAEAELEKAHAAALRELTRTKSDAEATVVEKELLELRKRFRFGDPAGSALIRKGASWVGTDRWTEGPHAHGVPDAVIEVTERKGDQFKGVYRWRWQPPSTLPVGSSPISGRVENGVISWTDGNNQSYRGRIASGGIFFHKSADHGTGWGILAIKK